MTTTTHDTAAALKAVLAAIDSDTHDGRAVSLSDHAALHRAITAHVEAEVARRLAAAPDVEQQIDLLRRASYTGSMVGMGPGGVRETIDRLRAAIAADKARAVADARRVGFKAGSAERSSVHDAIGVSPQEAARAAMAHGVPCPTCGSEARPTPDEAHRMINELIGATAIIGNGLDDDPGTVVAKRIAKDARAALLRALGVEA